MAAPSAASATAVTSPHTSAAGIAVVRAAHGLITAFFVSYLSMIYYAAVTRRRRRLALAACLAVSAEGAVVFMNGGECPLGRVHRRFGDERTFFELLMPARMARHAVPVLSAVAAAGMALLALRRPRATARWS